MLVVQVITIPKSWIRFIQKMQSAKIPASENIFPNVRAKIDLRNIVVVTDDNIPFLFQYDLQRITIVVKPDQSSSLKCTIHFVDHNISFNAKSTILEQRDLNERTFTFPPIKGSLRLSYQRMPTQPNGFLDLICYLEISYIHNTITPNLLSSIILFQVCYTNDIVAVTLCISQL